MYKSVCRLKSTVLVYVDQKVYVGYQWVYVDKVFVYKKKKEKEVYVDSRYKTNDSVSNSYFKFEIKEALDLGDNTVRPAEYAHCTT